MKCIDALSEKELLGKRVLVRGGLNVPVKNGIVVNDFRLRRIVMTLSFLKDRGARIILIGHIGRGGEESLKPAADSLRKFLPITFVPKTTGSEVIGAIESMKDGEVLLLENLRKDPREEKNDSEFSKELASYADVFVNDAFSASHRAHSSIVGVAEILPAYAGLVMKDEVEHLQKARSPKGPSLAIVGGSKFETKEHLIETLLGVYDHVFVTGALANDMFKAKGFEVGRSLVSDANPSAKVLDHEGVIIPIDVTAETKDGHGHVTKADNVVPDEKIVDIGPDTIAVLAPYIKNAKTILWNGPTGLYEGGYDQWTRTLATLVAKSDAFSIVGGGDTIATIQEEGLEEQFGFLSTGGGAMLEFLLKGTLPGIEALERN